MWDIVVKNEIIFQAFFGFGQAAEISVKLDDAENRKASFSFFPLLTLLRLKFCEHAAPIIWNLLTYGCKDWVWFWVVYWWNAWVREILESDYWLSPWFLDSLFQVAKIRCEEGGQETHFLFYDGETISGTVSIAVKKKFDHQGIRIEFIGQIGSVFLLNFDLFCAVILRKSRLVRHIMRTFEFMQVFLSESF